MRRRRGEMTTKVRLAEWCNLSRAESPSRKRMVPGFFKRRGAEPGQDRPVAIKACVDVERETMTPRCLRHSDLPTQTCGLSAPRKTDDIRAFCEKTPPKDWFQNDRHRGTAISWSLRPTASAGCRGLVAPREPLDARAGRDMPHPLRRQLAFSRTNWQAIIRGQPLAPSEGLME